MKLARTPAHESVRPCGCRLDVPGQAARLPDHHIIDPRTDTRAFVRQVSIVAFVGYAGGAHCPPRRSSIRPSMFRMSALLGPGSDGRPGPAKVVGLVRAER